MEDIGSSLTRYVAIVPGIMGSTLSYPNGEIWGDNIFQNYRRLSKSSTQLRWVGTKAKAQLWKTVGVVPPFHIRLWHKTLNYLAAHPELPQSRVIECPYDWRQSLQGSSADIVRLLEVSIGRSLNGPPGLHSERITILTHSMGALAIRVAIGQRLLDPGWIDRIIHMAPPLQGAPVAFRSLIYRTTLPFLNETVRILHFVNYHRMVKYLFEAFQTFDSIYELMPPQDNKFLVEAGTKRSNPLDGGWFDSVRVEKAMQTHAFIAESHTILQSSKIPVFSIFTKDHSGSRTDWEYVILEKSHEIKDPFSPHEGDGTVPSYSADVAQYTGCHPLPIPNVSHMKMPNSTSAVDLLKGCGL
jgi:hypothetical protein